VDGSTWPRARRPPSACAACACCASAPRGRGAVARARGAAAGPGRRHPRGDRGGPRARRPQACAQRAGRRDLPALLRLAPRITIEPEIADERGWVAGAFGAAGITPETIVVGVEPTPEEIAAAAEQAGAADAAVLFLFDAHLYASNRALLEAIQRGRAGWRWCCCAIPTTPRC